MIIKIAAGKLIDYIIQCHIKIELKCHPEFSSGSYQLDTKASSRKDAETPGRGIKPILSMCILAFSKFRKCLTPYTKNSQ